MPNHLDTRSREARAPRPITFALVGGLVAATLDILYAIVFFGFRGVSTLRILQSVASGVLGPAAYSGGVAAALLGLVLHFAIMLVIALLFFLAARRVAWLVRHPIVSGVAYGIAVYWVMNLVVVPLSASPAEFTFDPVVVPAGVVVHMLFIGIPIALATRAGLSTDAPNTSTRQ